MLPNLGWLDRAPLGGRGNIGMNPPDGPLYNHDGLKQKLNSGGRAEWEEISRDVIQLPFGHWDAFAPDQMPLYERGTMMYALRSTLGRLPQDSSVVGRDLVMQQTNSSDLIASFASETSPVGPPSKLAPPVILVKMWGFAGMVKAQDLLERYAVAVKTLVSTQAFQDAAKGGAQIVLHFDGDAAYEKAGSKFSHNLFAPHVSKLLKEAVAKILKRTVAETPIHLVVTKVDTIDAKGPMAILKKLCDVDEGATACRFRTAPTDGVHSYPYYDARFFDSAAVYVSGKWQAGGHGPVDKFGSEGQNSAMMEQLFENRVKKRFCLGVGGNTTNPMSKENKGGGVASTSTYIAAGLASKFDVAVRADVVAYG